MGRNQRGSVFVETLLILPPILVLVLGAWQLAELIGGTLAARQAAQEAARAAAVHPLDAQGVANRSAFLSVAAWLPPLPGEEKLSAEIGLPANVRFAGRGLLWAQLAESGGLTDELSLITGIGNPLAVRARLFFLDGEDLQEPADPEAIREAIQADRPGVSEVRVRFRVPLRIPLANRLFAEGKGEPGRTVEATARFPL